MTLRSLNLRLMAGTADATAAAAQAITDLVARQPDAVLGLATGGTMEPLYAQLVAAHRAGLSFARVRTVNLDEYVGLPPAHPNSYHSYMAQHFLDHVDIPAGQSLLPRGDLPPKAAAAEYAALLDRLGPVDLQLLGIGANGHIGFNEPGTPLDAPTRLVWLSPETVSDNARFFATGDAVPRQAVTMGTRAILSARRIVVLATGRAKAPALAAALDGPVGTDCPASYLRLHSDCTILLDPAAGSLLQRQTASHAT